MQHWHALQPNHVANPFAKERFSLLFPVGVICWQELSIVIQKSLRFERPGIWPQSGVVVARPQVGQHLIHFICTVYNTVC